MFQSNNTNIFLYLQQYHIGYVTISTQYGKVNKLVTYIYSVIRVKCSFGVFGTNAQRYPLHSHRPAEHPVCTVLRQFAVGATFEHTTFFHNTDVSPLSTENPIC